MTPLSLLPLLFAFTYASVEEGDTRNLIDYYFDYYNDGASCDRTERSTIRNLTDDTEEGLRFVLDLEIACGPDNANCVQAILSDFDIGLSCSLCFSNFIFETALFFCPSECYLGEFNEADCLDCLENSGGLSEIELENCVGLDLIRDDQFNTCVGELDVEVDFFDLPLILQQTFNDLCKGEQSEYLVQGANCLTSEIHLNFGVSQDCANCVRDHAICINEFCSSQCEGSNSTLCFECVQETQCAFDFDSCSGLNFYGFGVDDGDDGGEYYNPNYFGDYYFNYENDGASCNRQERFTLGGLTGFSADTVFFLNFLEGDCGTNGNCIRGILSENDISSPCADCFTNFIVAMSFDCSSECFGFANFSESLCLECLETFNSFDEVFFETCAGLDILPDNEFDACINQEAVEDNIGLPQQLQNTFDEICKGDQFNALLIGANCLTDTILSSFEVQGEDCADCLRDHAICINEFCRIVCEGNGDLTACIACVENSRCASEFDSCSGVNLYFRGNGNDGFGDDDDGNVGYYYNYDFYFGDYYFNYENDGASCDRQERLTLGGLTGFSADTLFFLNSLEDDCGTDGSCIEEILSFNDISSPCADCFSDFISAISFDCSFECFGSQNFSEFSCLECLETFASSSEITFEGCVGADLLPDDEFDTCVDQLDADENIGLPQDLQSIFDDNCKNGEFFFVEGTNCVTSEVSIIFGVDEDCADCLRDHAICINEFCFDQCQRSSDLRNCIGCVQNSRCAGRFDSCSGLNLYFRGNGYDNYGYGDYGFYYYDGGNVFLNTIIDILNEFFVNFIGEFINNFLSIFFGE